MMPLSFQGFGSMAILLMVFVLVTVEGVRYLSEKFHHK